MPKLRNDVEFKKDDVRKPDIFLYLEQSAKPHCASLRTSASPLAVEGGQLKATPAHLRLCEFCDLQVEMSFML